MNNITTIGIDLAKNIFQVHCNDKNGNKVKSKRLTRKQLPEFIANLSSCLIGMEACSSAHYWARLFTSYGHDVKLMSPQYVKPYVKTNKNDMADAEAIAEAVTRSNMRFVPIKNTAQQDILCLHKVRERIVKNRTSLSNQIRGLLLEYGITVNIGKSALKAKLAILIDDESLLLTPMMKELISDLYAEYVALDEKVKLYDTKIENLVQSNEQCKRLMAIPGVGPISATAMYASLGNVSVFKKGRHVSAWLGIVPKQLSSGNKTLLCGISKRGNGYLRQLLIHGGRAVLKSLGDKNDNFSSWARKLSQRAGFNKAAVAIANKNARHIWALLSGQEKYNDKLACRYNV